MRETISLDVFSPKIFGKRFRNFFVNIKHWFQNYYQEEKLHYNFRKRKSLRALHPFRGFLHEKATAKNKASEESEAFCGR